MCENTLPHGIRVRIWVNNDARVASGVHLKTSRVTVSELDLGDVCWSRSVKLGSQDHGLTKALELDVGLGACEFGCASVFELIG